MMLKLFGREEEIHLDFVYFANEIRSQFIKFVEGILIQKKLSTNSWIYGFEFNLKRNYCIHLQCRIVT